MVTPKVWVSAHFLLRGPVVGLDHGRWRVRLDMENAVIVSLILVRTLVAHAFFAGPKIPRIHWGVISGGLARSLRRGVQAWACLNTCPMPWGCRRRGIT